MFHFIICSTIPNVLFLMCLSVFGDEYVNRKNLCSFNVQATCDANEWFTSVNTRWAGSVEP